MTSEEFWKLVDATRRRAKGDPEAHIEALTDALEVLSESEIIEFDRIFSELHARAYTWHLWAAAYIVGGGCSDDGFSDFRGWLISKGSKAFESAVASPDSLVRVIKDEDGEGQVEGFQYAPGEAWSRKTGKDYSSFPAATVEVPKDPAGLRWDEEDEPELQRLCPKLFKKFWDA